MWEQGNINGYNYWVKHYPAGGSHFGINNGRISKLCIRKSGSNEDLVNYDRGWDVAAPVESEEVMAIYEQLIKKYN